MESRVERKVDWGSTSKFTSGLPYITSIKSTHVNFMHVHM